MIKHILVADSTTGADRRYVASTKGGALATDLTDAALFGSEEAATAGARSLLARDFERTREVALLLGTVKFELTSTSPVRRAAPRAGYVLRRAKGDYYRGPKSRRPRDFQDAYYSFVPNRDVATVFQSEEVAAVWGEACREILRDVAERDLRTGGTSGTYQTILDEFGFTIEAV